MRNRGEDMQIIGIQVYGYGKLENIEFGNLHPNLQVFFGKNEAGKSTLMSFIHSILFGFPTKQQNEQRYIPKTGSKYGGKLILQTKEYGTLMIERLPGKAAGDVKVYFPDGTVKGEDFIYELFQGMDKNLYQNVYSFNIHGLQGIHHLTSEDVGRFLFSAGTVGTDALLGLQDKLTKEMDGLYKPKGKNPPLNMELIRLKEEHIKVSKWQEKNNIYEELLEEKQQLEKELENLDSKKRLIREKIYESEKLQTIQPILEEYQILVSQLKSLPRYEPYPEDGLKRFEQLQAQLKPYEAQAAAIQAQAQEWEKEKDAIELSPQYLENEKHILDLVENRNLYTEKKNRLHQVTRDLEQLEEELNQLKNRVRFSLPETDIFTLDLSISAKETFSEIVAETVRHKQQKHYLDDSFTKAKEQLENSEIKLCDLKRQVLPDDERKYYENKKHQYTTRESLEEEKSKLEEEIKRIDQKIVRETVREKEIRSKFTRLFYGIALTLAIISIYFYVSQEWMTGGILTILALFMLPIGRTVISQMASTIIHELHEDREALLKKLQTIQEQLLQSNQTDNEDISSLLLRDQHIRQQLEIEQATLQQYERAYEKVLEGFEEWETTGFTIEEKATNIKKTYGLPLNISNELLMDAFQILEAIRDKVLTKQKLIEAKGNLQNEISDFQVKVNRVGKQLNILELGTIRIDRLAIRLEEEKKKVEQHTQFEEKVKNAKEQNSKLTFEINHLQNEIKVLWDIAQVSSEEEYRAKGQANERAKELNERINILKAQLDRFGELVSKCNYETNYKNLIVELSAELGQYHESEKEIQSQLSAVNHSLLELEEGGTYADFLHSYEANKSVVKNYAKRWATLAVAKDILSKTIDQYRKLRLPKVVEKAEQYFSILTNQRYKRIYIDNDADGFIVEDANGMRYKPNELSQATSEQLYIAIRFSLAYTMHPNHSFPFIIDDSFVNFDSHRLASAMSLIKELAKEHQVLLFTCHQHVMEGFGENNPIYLESGYIQENSKSML